LVGLIAGYEGARSDAPMMTEVRSTWVTSSVLGLREHGHYERYVARLAPEHRSAVLDAVAGSWLPVSAFAAHYAACDAIAIPEDEQVAMGQRTTRHLHGTMLDLTRRLAREAGATPWAPLGQASRLFARVARGGAVFLHRLGPKEARLDLFGYPVAGSTYARLAMRGAVGSLAGILGHRAYVHDVRSLCTSTRLSYRVQWA
jgi:hypothetical protein